MSYWFIVCLGFLVVTLFGALIGEFNNVLFSYSTVVSIIGALFRLSIAEQQVSLFYIIGGVFVVILLAEVMFWITKEPCPKTNVFWYTAAMKSENIVEILLLGSIITNVYYLIRDINFKVMFGYLIKICTFISIAGLIVLILYVWIRLNMLKYRGEDHGRRKNKHR